MKLDSKFDNNTAVSYGLCNGCMFICTDCVLSCTSCQGCIGKCTGCGTNCFGAAYGGSREP